MATILHVADYAAPYSGNFINSLGALRKACEARGHRFVLALPVEAFGLPWCLELGTSGMEVVRLRREGSVPSRALRLARLAAKEKATIVHTHFSHYDVAAPLASATASLFGKGFKTVWHFHSNIDMPPSLSRTLKDAFKFRLLSRFLKVITVSDHVRDQLLAQGCPASSLQTIENAIDVAHATKSGAAARVRAEAGVNGKESVVLMFGWHPVDKGVDVALRGVERLVKAGKPVVLVIGGTEDTRRFIAKNFGEVPSWVRILPPREAVADFYQAADAFLQAGRYEGFCYALAEAMANERPVVSSDIPGCAWIRRFPGAAVFPSEDDAALAASLETILSWPAAKRAGVVRDNLAILGREFSLDRWTGEIIKVYEKPARA